MTTTVPQDPRRFAAERLDPALAGQVAALLDGAVDLHCHSGPAVMPRTLDHYEAMRDAEAARFRALVYKDHFYPGMAQAALLQRMFPENRLQLFSGIALNNSNGGINPHAVDHALKFGARIVWMPTMSAANHVAKALSDATNFPKPARKLLDPVPLTILGGDGRLTDETLQVIDLVAEADIILAGGHLHISEQHLLFEAARARGVRKMLVNHPTHLIDCTDADIRQLAGMGIYLEHSIVMFIEGMTRKRKFPIEEALRLIDVAGADRTLFCSDLGLEGSPVPVDGYRFFVQELIGRAVPDATIRKIIAANGAALLNLE